MDDDAIRVIDEATIQNFPRLTEPRSFSRLQRHDIEMFNPFLAGLELRLRFCSAAELMHSSAVFGAKAFLKIARLFFLVIKPRCKRNHGNDQNAGENDPG